RVLFRSKTHLRGAQIVLRSKTPELVQQEFWGLLMAHYAIRGLMHEAALKANEDPDRLSFLHSVRVVQRRMARYVAIPPSAEESPATRRSWTKFLMSGSFRAASGSTRAVSSEK